MARWFRFRLSVSGPFVCRCLTSGTMLRFHLPLIEPDLQISRIRLSDKGSYFRPRNVAVAQLELDQTQLTMQIVSGVACKTSILHFVLLTQPPTEPDTGVAGNRRLRSYASRFAKAVGSPYRRIPALSQSLPVAKWYAWCAIPQLDQPCFLVLHYYLSPYYIVFTCCICRFAHHCAPLHTASPIPA